MIMGNINLKLVILTYYNFPNDISKNDYRESRLKVLKTGIYYLSFFFITSLTII